MNIGQKLADKISSFLGTWTFVRWFCIFLIAWVSFNLTSLAFDVYPFILLNLFLSCFAAITMPIIMISQRDQGKKQKKQEEWMVQQTRTLLHLSQATQEHLKVLIKQEKEALSCKTKLPKPND